MTMVNSKEHFINLSQKTPSEENAGKSGYFKAQYRLLNQNSQFSINPKHMLFPNPVFVAEKWKSVFLGRHLPAFHYHEICMLLESWFEALFNLSSNAVSFADSLAQIE